CHSCRGVPERRDEDWHRDDVVFFFFQAEDGIRDATVTGVQTCALPIWQRLRRGRRTSRTSFLSANSAKTRRGRPRPGKRMNKLYEHCFLPSRVKKRSNPRSSITRRWTRPLAN